jgi:hypothetical protein
MAWSGWETMGLPGPAGSPPSQQGGPGRGRGPWSAWWAGGRTATLRERRQQLTRSRSRTRGSTAAVGRRARLGRVSRLLRLVLARPCRTSLRVGMSRPGGRRIGIARSCQCRSRLRLGLGMSWAPHHPHSSAGPDDGNRRHCGVLGSWTAWNSGLNAVPPGSGSGGCSESHTTSVTTDYRLSPSQRRACSHPEVHSTPQPLPGAEAELSQLERLDSEWMAAAQSSGVRPSIWNLALYDIMYDISSS